MLQRYKKFFIISESDVKVLLFLRNKQGNEPYDLPRNNYFVFSYCHQTILPKNISKSLIIK